MGQQDTADRLFYFFNVMRYSFVHAVPLPGNRTEKQQSIFVVSLVVNKLKNKNNFIKYQ